MAGGMAARAALYAAVLAVGASFGLLFEGSGGTATVRMLGAAVVGLAAGSAGRYRFALLPPAAVVYSAAAAYGPAALVPPGGWSAALSGLRQDLPVALDTMYLQPIPYEPSAGLVLVLVPLVVLLAGLAASAALYEQSPVFSVALLGVALGVISTVGFEAGVAPYFAVFLAAGLCLLAVTGSGRLSGLGLRGLAAGLAVVAGALVLPQTPLAEAAIRPALVDWTEIGGGDTSRLATEADVGDYLDSGRDTELMRVRSPEPLYWRGGTLDEFDGVRWSSTLEEGQPDVQDVSPAVETRTVRQSFEIRDAETDILFGGYDIQDVSLASADPRSDGSWTAGYSLAKGQSYEVLSEVPQPTGIQLSGSGTSYPEEIRGRFLQLPADRPEEVAETAQTVQRDYSPSDPYEKARAIQRYLLYDGDFTYNLDVSYRRADRAIEDFLGDGREGFCTQFATSMALVAREMGVPARVVYGATSGEEVRENEYVVRGGDMHTWVEIYFPGIGWYPFDPTPGRGVNATMGSNSPDPSGPASDTGSQALNPALEDGGSGGDSGTTDAAASPGDSGGSGGTESGWTAYALSGGAAAAALGAVPLAKAALLRRGRPRDYYLDVVGRLEDALPRSPGPQTSWTALTPAERLSSLARSTGLDEESMLPLARAYSEHLYSPQPASGLAAAHAEARRACGRLSPARRALGAFNPASLLRRGSMAFSRLPGRVAR